MTEERLNNIAIIMFNKQVTVNFDSIVDKFAAADKRRMSMGNVLKILFISFLVHLFSRRNNKLQDTSMALIFMEHIFANWLILNISQLFIFTEQ